MQFDTIDATSDNSSINDKNETEVIVIKPEELTPINDPTCKHYFVKDSDGLADNNEMQAWVCRECRRGTFLPKDKTIINS